MCSVIYIYDFYFLNSFKWLLRNNNTSDNDLRWNNFNVIGWIQANFAIFPAFTPTLFVFVFKLLEYFSCKYDIFRNDFVSCSSFAMVNIHLVWMSIHRFQLHRSRITLSLVHPVHRYQLVYFRHHLHPILLPQMGSVPICWYRFYGIENIHIIISSMRIYRIWIIGKQLRYCRWPIVWWWCRRVMLGCRVRFRWIIAAVHTHGRWLWIVHTDCCSIDTVPIVLWWWILL